MLICKLKQKNTVANSRILRYYLTMPNIKTLKKPVREDWHKADIKAALEKKGWTLRGLSAYHGLSHGSVRAALDGNSSVCEVIIADVLGLTPKEIWPSRFEGNNTKNRRRCNVKQCRRAKHEQC